MLASGICLASTTPGFTGPRLIEKLTTIDARRDFQDLTRVRPECLQSTLIAGWKNVGRGQPFLGHPFQESRHSSIGKLVLPADGK